MTAFKLQEFSKEQPKSSVILPIFDGEKSPNYSRLLKELKSQTFQDFEVIVSAVSAPNGRARNEGVTLAKGDYLIFIDETIYLPKETILENLMRSFQSSEKVAVVGASCGPFPELNWIQRQYFVSRGFYIPSVNKPSLNARVQHGCMAVSKKVFQQVGWESDRLMTGTDNDLLGRITRAGYEIMAVPDTHVFYEPPKSFAKILKKSYVKGQGSAFAFMIYPGLFEFSSHFKIKNSWSACLYKFLSTLSKFFQPWFWLRPVVLCCEVMICVGFISGCMKWSGQKPDLLRSDLRRS